MSYADIILTGGRVWRGLHEGFAEALAVYGGRIVACGARDAVKALAGPRTRRVDLGGRVAVPAFNDSHQHLLPLGLTMGQVNLRSEEVRTLDELLRRIRDAALRAGRGEWVLGRGYDHAELDVGRHPTADELTVAAPDNPVFIVRACGHVGVANRAALSLAGVTPGTPDPAGGLIERSDGDLTGLFAERAMRLVRDRVPEPTDAALVNAIERAGTHMLEQGFTAVMDACVGMTAGMREIDAYRTAQDEDRLPVRTWVCLSGNPEGIAAAAWQAGIRPMQGDDMLRFGAVKVFGDGSAGGRTAAFSDPYVQGGTGMFCFADADMREMLARYHHQGWQLAIHAIGDAGIEQVLAAMEAADAPDAPVAGRRHRIEHCGFLAASQIARMAARGIEPVPQGIFLYEFGDLYVANLGRARAEAAYPMRTWFDAGQNPAAGSDAPVSSTDPFRNIWTQVARTTRTGTVLGADQRIAVAEAVHSYTYCSAYTQFAEQQRGRLLPGMLADIAVLSQDIFACDTDAIPATRADLVLRGGRQVFDRDRAVT